MVPPKLPSRGGARGGATFKHDKTTEWLQDPRLPVILPAPLDGNLL